MRSPSAWLTACSCALVLAACSGSGSPQLPAGYARQAVAQADRIAGLLEADRWCAAARLAARLQAATIRAINARGIPAELQEELLGRISGLAAVIPCGEPGPAGTAPAEEARAVAAWLRDHAS